MGLSTLRSGMMWNPLIIPTIGAAYTLEQDFSFFKYLWLLGEMTVSIYKFCRCAGSLASRRYLAFDLGYG